MSIQRTIGTIFGDIWLSWSMVGIWPYPAVGWGRHRGEFTWDDYRCFCNCLQPGDFILSQSHPFAVMNSAIKHTAYKHLAVYVGPAQCARNPNTGFLEGVREFDPGTKTFRSSQSRGRVCVHAVRQGVVGQDLGEVLFHGDYVCAVRAWKRTEDQRSIIKGAISMLGRPYDFSFNSDDDNAIFCTELGSHCMRWAGLGDVDRTELTVSLLGRTSRIPLADAFVLHVETKPVCCSVSSLDERFINQSTKPDAMRERLRGMENARDGY